MTRGDLTEVPGCSDLYYHATGMYDVDGYGSVYIFDTEHPAVIDTGIGTNVETLMDSLSALDIGADDLEYIVPTHIHLDHAGGAGFLAESYPNATVLVHELGVDHLVDPSRLVAGTKAAVEDQWEFYVEPKPVPADRIDALEDGSTIDLGDRTLTAHHAPGHAPHQLIFSDDGDDVVFTADAAGIWVAERNEIRETSPPPQFDLDQCLEDVSMIQALEPSQLCFAHFGPVPYDEELLSGYKRTLVEWVEAVRQRRAEFDTDEAVIEHFVTHVDTEGLWSDRKARDETRINVRGVLAYLDRVEA
ncbi:MBL fold metallo-hydrolase [Halalkalirubrum salinum]|uniref:MBL fold metallo-hydrolase n=1 Tax=Halalkalirubrum salinum TaxID=2563889 RepID=UPI0010FB2D9C|nr:MBL fold metallo-hydrolase [Halalkalirubrum salinum]